MKLTVRVGDTLADLHGFNRVSVEAVGRRLFLVGVRNSGRVVALFAVKREKTAFDVMEGLQAALGSGRYVCALTNELNRIEDDADAGAELESHNREHDRAAEVGKPHTAAESAVDVETH